MAESPNQSRTLIPLNKVRSLQSIDESLLVVDKSATFLVAKATELFIEKLAKVKDLW